MEHDFIGYRQLENVHATKNWPPGEILSMTKSSGKQQHPRSITQFIYYAYMFLTTVVDICVHLHVPGIKPRNTSRNYAVIQVNNITQCERVILSTKKPSDPQINLKPRVSSATLESSHVITNGGTQTLF